MSTSNAAAAAPAPIASAPVVDVAPKIESADLSPEEQDAESKLDSSEDSVDENSNKPIDKTKKKTEKEIEKRIKKLKLKVDGKEIEESLDLDNDEELIRHLQMAKMGQNRAQKLSDLEKQIQAFFTAFQKDPLAAAAELGMKPDQIIDQYINKQLENAKKTPEQIEAEKARAELQALKDEREKEKDEASKRELARLQEQAFQQYDMQMDQVLSKSDLPKTPYVIKKMADYMLVALEAGKDVTPDDVVDLVREEMQSDIQTMLTSLPEDKLEELLGEQQLNRLRKRRIAKAQTAQKAVGKSQVQDTGKSGKDSDKPRDKKSFKEFFGV